MTLRRSTDLDSRPAPPPAKPSPADLVVREIVVRKALARALTRHLTQDNKGERHERRSDDVIVVRDKQTPTNLGDVALGQPNPVMPLTRI